MSKTPRTDKVKMTALTERSYDKIECVPVELSYRLETELVDKEKQLAERTRQRDAYKKALEMAEDELMTARADAEHWKSECNALQRMAHEARAEIERLRGVIISQITPEPLVLSSYSTTTEPAKDERDKLIEQMREALNLMLEGAIHDFHYVCQHRDNCLCWGCQKVRVKAALAAERGE